MLVFFWDTVFFLSYVIFSFPARSCPHSKALLATRHYPSARNPRRIIAYVLYLFTIWRLGLPGGVTGEKVWQFCTTMVYNISIHIWVYDGWMRSPCYVPPVYSVHYRSPGRLFFSRGRSAGGFYIFRTQHARAAAKTSWENGRLYILYYNDCDVTAPSLPLVHHSLS